MKHSAKFITFLSAKTAFLILDLGPIFPSGEYLFRGTISKPKHQGNVFMAGTEYLGETAQPLDQTPVNTTRKSPAITHFRSTDQTINNHA